MVLLTAPHIVSAAAAVSRSWVHAEATRGKVESGGGHTTEPCHSRVRVGSNTDIVSFCMTAGSPLVPDMVILFVFTFVALLLDCPSELLLKAAK